MHKLIDTKSTWENMMTALSQEYKICAFFFLNEFCVHLISSGS